jgi:hypothetical protein
VEDDKWFTMTCGVRSCFENPMVLYQSITFSTTCLSTRMLFGFVLSAKIHFSNTVIVPTWCHVNRGRACIAQAIAHEDALVKKSCTDYEKCLVCSSTVRRYRRGLNQLAYEMRASGGFQNGRTEPPLIAACGAGR